MCYDYRQCIAVWDVESWSHFSSNDKAISKPEGVLDKSKPSVVCDEKNKRTAQGKEECEEVCDKWSCCWSAKNCFNSNEGKQSYYYDKVFLMSYSG